MKQKQQKMKQKKKPDLLSDMDSILSDPRFSHVATDPKLRYIPKEKTKVKIDDRFSSLMTDSQFYETSTMDPRGKKGNFSSKDDLKRFYSMSSSGSSSDADDESNEEEEETKKVQKKKNKKKKSPNPSDEEIDDSDNEDQQRSEDDGDRDSVTTEKNEEIPTDIKEQLLKYDFSRGVTEFTDSSDDDSSTTDEDEERGIDEFEWGELDKDAIWDDEENEVEETRRFAVCNMNWDRINSTDLMLLFSSSLPPGGTIKSVKIYLSQYGKDRLAEENRSGPQEIVEFSSGANKYAKQLKELERLEKGQLREDSGSTSKSRQEAIRRYQRNRLKYYYAVVECDSVTTSSHVYKECDRIAFEGSGTLLDLRYIPEDMSFDEDAIDLCEKLPKNYTIKQFTTSALHDAVPTMTWDETAADRKKDLSTVMNQITKGEEPDYDRLEAYIASNSEDDETEETETRKKERAKKLRKLLKEIDRDQKKKEKQKQMFDDPTEDNNMHSNSDGSSNDEANSESESEELLQSDEEDDDGSNSSNEILPHIEDDDSKVSSFRSIVQDLNKDEVKKKTNESVDKVEVFNVATKENNIKNGAKTKKNKLTPFEEFLEKRKEKRKTKAKVAATSDSSESEESDNEELSDDSLPEDMGDLMNDPYFAEEINATNNNQNKQNIKKKKKKKSNKDIEDDKPNEDLALLVMAEEESNKKHFNMRKILEDQKKQNKKKGKFSKKKSKKEIEEQKQMKREANKFEVKLDSRFSELMTSSDFHIDPTHSSFKKTDGMDQIIDHIQNKRFAETSNDTPSPKKKCLGTDSNNPEINKIISKLKYKSKIKKNSN